MGRTTTTLLASALLLFGACSTSDDGGGAAESAALATTTTVATTESAAPAGEDLDTFCAGFDELAEGRVPGDPSRLDLGDGSAEDAAAAYAAQRATVVEIAQAAPEEMRDNAETYIQVIDRRAQAEADTAGEGLTPEERIELGQGLAEQQAEINELLAYARETCPGFE